MITKIKTESREEWLALRKGHIGGSDAAAVVGLNPYASQYSLWAEKTGRVDGFAGNLATEVGAYLEEFVAKKFEEETGKRVRRANQSILNSDYPFAIANIDREIVGEDAGLEIKTTDSLNMGKFKGGEYPSQYYAQIVHYMAVTGKQKWYLAVLIGNRDFKIFTIDRDDAEISSLMAAEKDFWDCVTNDTPPPVDGSEATSKALQGVYPESGDDVVDLFGRESHLREIVALGERIKDLEQRREEVINQIKQDIGNACGGELDGFRVTWKTQTRRSFDHKRFAEDNPGVDLSEYWKETKTRPFRVFCDLEGT